MRSLRWVAASSLLLLAATREGDADACATFGKPSALAHAERCLVVFDQKAGREHLFREIDFGGSPESFGFVMAVPSEPEIGAVDGDLFGPLSTAAPFERAPDVASDRFVTSRHDPEPLDRGIAKGGRSPSLRVSPIKNLGTFSAATLKADDPKELEAWLARHKLKKPETTARWLSKHIEAGSYFVAFFREPAGELRADVQTHVIRVSFDTPQPFYPYSEPDDQRAPGPSLTRLWLVAPSPMLPVSAMREPQGALVFKRPFEEGYRTRAPLSGLGLPDAVASLLPREGAVTIQTFRDGKSTRAGWGDVVFAPETPAATAPEATAARRKLARLMLPREAP